MSFAEALKKNLNSIYGEFFGERTDHPVLARLLAFLIDYVVIILLFALELLIAFLIDHESPFVPLSAILIITSAYFTLGNSKVFTGQTLGKKIFRVRVTDLNGNSLSFFQSFIRSVFLTGFINFYTIFSYIREEKYDTIHSPLYISLIIIFFASIYFPVVSLNRRTAHDLLVSSQVIPSKRVVKTSGRVSLLSLIGFIILIAIYLFLIFR